MKCVLFFLFLLVSCLKNNLEPESALQSFIEARSGKTVTRDFLLSHVTGKMRESLKNISDEDFKKYSDLRKIRMGSFKILSKSCQMKLCYLTYTLSYNSQNQGQASFATEVKKIAELVNEDGKWLLADITNIKTYHEALETINP